MNPLIGYIVKFFLLILLQLLVIDQVDIGYMSQFIIPSVYILYVLTLPHTMTNSMLMLLGFAIGITIDIFKSTPGMHASAMVVLAYTRPYLLKNLEPRDGYDVTKSPSVYSMKRNYFILYSGLGALAFNLWYFSIEVMRFSDFHLILIKTLLSSIVSVLLIVLIQYLTVKK